MYKITYNFALNIHSCYIYDKMCIRDRSGTYNSCRLAAMNLAEKYPDNKIIVIDSLCASMGEGLFVHKAVTVSYTHLCPHL